VGYSRPRILGVKAASSTSDQPAPLYLYHFQPTNGAQDLRVVPPAQRIEVGGRPQDDPAEPSPAHQPAFPNLYLVHLTGEATETHAMILYSAGSQILAPA
jgi:hypothetical protein